MKKEFHLLDRQALDLLTKPVHLTQNSWGYLRVELTDTTSDDRPKEVLGISRGTFTIPQGAEWSLPVYHLLIVASLEHRTVGKANSGPRACVEQEFRSISGHTPPRQGCSC